MRYESKIIPIAALSIAIWFIVLVPFRIIGYGFLPPDDAMRHSAKAISGKDWNQILVLRDNIKMDSHPGWHAILNFVRQSMKWDAHLLVLFSVIYLFLLFALAPLPFLRYPEAWLTSFALAAMVSPWWLFRLFLGRPYLFTMACLAVICFLWPSLKERKIQYRTVILLTFLVAASTWIHCSWYLFLIPIVSLFLARQARAGIVMTASSIIGIWIGACLTEHPVLFLKQTLTHLFLAFGTHDAEYLLVGEFRPGLADTNMLFVVLMVLIWKALRGKKIREAIDNPVFIIAAITFVLGFFSRRFWYDWGMVAACVWMAQEFEEFLSEHVNIYSLKRLAITGVSAIVLYMAITADVNSRWTSVKPRDRLSAEDQAQKPWLPGPGGIIYSDSMEVFYQTFYANPHGNWRYMLGFEPALMPKEDLEIFRNIQRNNGAYHFFTPWVKKMRPEDRLILKGNSEQRPKIPDLEWNYVALGTWIGRKPQEVKK